MSWKTPRCYWINLLLLAQPLMGGLAPEDTLAKMSLDAKIGQLLILEASPGSKLNNSSLLHSVEKGLVGGVFLTGNWTAGEEIALLNKLQEASAVPLFAIQECEWGFGMHVQDAVQFPKNNTLANVDNALIHKMGVKMGQDAKRLGVHLCLAPIADVNTNFNNPVIGLRSFGNDPKNVAAKSAALTQGIQSQGVMASAKHFPGHGDTSVDSRLALPVLTSDWESICEGGLVPFRELVDQGVGSITVGHLYCPKVDKDLPSSLSSELIQKKLKGDLAYQGLVITDDLNMKGVSGQFDFKDRVVKSYLAGNNLITVMKDPEQAIAAIKGAIAEGQIKEEELNQRVLKVLNEKQKWISQAAQEKEVPWVTNQDIELTKQMFAQAIERKNGKQWEDLPVINPEERVFYLQIGGMEREYFKEALQKRREIVANTLDPYKVSQQATLIQSQCNAADRVIVAYYDSSIKYQRIPLGNEALSLIETVMRWNPNTTVIYFADPYPETATGIVAFEAHEGAEDAVAEKLAGKAF